MRELSNNQELVWVSIAKEKRESKSPYNKKKKKECVIQKSPPYTRVTKAYKQKRE